MCLGRMEKIYTETGKPVSVTCATGIKRQHTAWIGNPAWDNTSPKSIIDGGGYRPYIKYWQGDRVIFEESHKAHAGRIYLTAEEKDFIPIKGEYVVAAPHLKSTASPNKSWGFERWQEVVNNITIPVVQLMENEQEKILENTISIKTKTFRLAASVISRANLVMCNEGGTHHMAASMGIPAVVVFGSFISPEITGYDFHANFTTKSAHYCGNWANCEECKKQMDKITPDMVSLAANKFLGGNNAQGIYRI